MFSDEINHLIGMRLIDWDLENFKKVIDPIHITTLTSTLITKLFSCFLRFAFEKEIKKKIFEECRTWIQNSVLSCKNKVTSQWVNSWAPNIQYRVQRISLRNFFSFFQFCLFSHNREKTFTTDLRQDVASSSWHESQKSALKITLFSLFCVAAQSLFMNFQLNFEFAESPETQLKSFFD